MSPLKKKATKKSSKHPCISSDSFRNDNASMAFLDHYKRAPIVLKRAMDLESLEGTFILVMFKERTWTKFLNPMGDVFEDIIREFFASATVEGDHINCWLRGREFSVLRESIQEVLEIRPATLDSSLQYDERNEKLETLLEVLGGQLKKKALHTIAFTPEMRALAYIMIFNLYPVKNLTTLSGPRTVFLYDLFTHKEIDICGHIYHLFVKSIKKSNARLILLFPSPVMSLILRARVKIPSGLPVMQRKTLLVSRPSFEAKLTFQDQASMYLRFRETKKQQKKVTPIKRLIDSLPYRRILHSLLLKCKQEHPTALIFYLEGLKSCI